MRRGDDEKRASSDILTAGARPRWDRRVDIDGPRVHLGPALCIAGGGAHVVGFADPDSATFAFRGGDPTGVRDFTERFRTVTGEEAPQLTLDTSYRSTVELVTATRRVANRLRGPAGQVVDVSHGVPILVGLQF